MIEFETKHKFGCARVVRIVNPQNVEIWVVTIEEKGKDCEVMSFTKRHQALSVIEVQSRLWEHKQTITVK